MSFEDDIAETRRIREELNAIPMGDLADRNLSIALRFLSVIGPEGGLRASALEAAADEHEAAVRHFLLGSEHVVRALAYVDGFLGQQN